MLLHSLRCLFLILAGCLVMARDVNQDRARSLQIEMGRLRGNQPAAALAKGEEALALVRTSPDARLEMELLMEVSRLQSRTGKLPEAAKSLDRGEFLAKSLRDAASQRAFGAIKATLRNLEGNHTEATRVAQQVLQEAQAAGDLPPTVVALSVLGQCAGATGNFPQGIQYLHQALEATERTQDLGSRQSVLSVLSTFYTRTQEWDKALKANVDSTVLARQLEDPNRLAILCLNASFIYSHLDRPEDEYRTLMEAEALGRKAGNLRILMAVEVNLADVLLKRKDYRAALEHADRGLEVARKIGDQIHVAVSLANRGVALNRLGKSELGLATLEASLKEHRATDSAGDEVDLLGILSEEYAFAGNHRKALEYHQAFKEKSDKLYHDARTKTVQELEARYQSEKQERKILQLQAEGHRRSLVRNFSIVGGLLALALAAALLARYRLLRRSSAELEALNRQLETLSITDPLTGLRNRRFFMQHVDQDTTQADRAHQAIGGVTPKEANRDLIFFIVDLDHFKHVNDTYGHHAGDLVLKQAVERLKSAIRESDELIRWGGEEFLLVARQTRREDAPILAERLRAAVARAPFDLGEQRSLPRTCSIGFAAYPLLPGAPGRPDWEAVVDLADQALYVAKTSGRNGWVGVSGAGGASGEDVASGLGSGLKGLVEQRLCEVRCSFPDPAALVWATPQKP